MLRFADGSRRNEKRPLPPIVDPVFNLRTLAEVNYLGKGFPAKGLGKGETCMMEQFRQGDVLFVKRACKPSENRDVRKSGHILEGEVTGHIHRLSESCLETAEVYEIEGKLFVFSEEGISIVHEEHHTLELPPGNYEIVRQREYSPEEVRNVAD